MDDEILAGLVLSGTTHTNAGDYLADPWAFTASPATTTTTRARSIRHRQGRPGLLGHRLLGALRQLSHTATGYCLGVNDEILAGLVLSGTTHTNAGDYLADPWAFTDVTGNYNDDAGTVDDAIAKVDPVCSVTGYSVPFDSFSHTATGSCLGVNDEILAGLVLSGTTHTNAGDYLADPWAFTDVTGNYNDDAGTVDDAIAKVDPVCSVTGYSVPFDSFSHTATGSSWA